MDSRRHIVRTAVALVVGVCAFAWVAHASAAAANDPCAASAGQVATIVAITSQGDMRFSDGRLGRLADIDLGADAVAAEHWNAHLDAIRTAISGLAVRSEDAAESPDRWGRRVLRLSPVADESVPLHRRLVERGLARVWPLDAEDACAISLLPLEADARAQNLGLWREPAAQLLAAADSSAILAATGRFAIIEGRILTVGQRPRRTYLNFGRDFRRDFAASFAPRTARLLEKAGIAPSSLRGKTVRVRGMVGGRRAPAMEIISASQIEVLK